MNEYIKSFGALALIVIRYQTTRGRIFEEVIHVLSQALAADLNSVKLSAVVVEQNFIPAYLEPAAASSSGPAASAAVSHSLHANPPAVEPAVLWREKFTITFDTIIRLLAPRPAPSADFGVLWNYLESNMPMPGGPNTFLAIPMSDRPAFDSLLLSANTKLQLDALATLYHGKPAADATTHTPNPLRIHFHGSSGTGKTVAAHAMAERLGLPLIAPDLGKLLRRTDTASFASAAAHACQPAAGGQPQRGYVLLLDEADKWVRRSQTNGGHCAASIARLTQLLASPPASPPVVVILVTRGRQLDARLEALFAGHQHVDFDQNVVDRAGRTMLWLQMLRGSATELGMGVGRGGGAVGVGGAGVVGAARLLLGPLWNDQRRVSALLAGRRRTGHQIRAIIEAAWVGARQEGQAVQDITHLRRAMAALGLSNEDEESDLEFYDSDESDSEEEESE